MNERIAKLTALTLDGSMHPSPTPTAYDRTDLLLPRAEMEVKRICEYIENQTPVLNEHCAFKGLLTFDGSCIGDAFGVTGHTEALRVMDAFYLKSIDNLSTM